MANGKVYAAVVSTECGPILYLDRTEPGVLKAVADFCREWWEEEMPNADGSLPDIPESDQEVVDVFFSYEHGKYLDLIGESEVEDRMSDGSCGPGSVNLRATAQRKSEGYSDLVIGDRSSL